MLYVIKEFVFLLGFNTHISLECGNTRSVSLHKITYTGMATKVTSLSQYTTRLPLKLPYILCKLVKKTRVFKCEIKIINF